MSARLPSLAAGMSVVVATIATVLAIPGPAVQDASDSKAPGDVVRTWFEAMNALDGTGDSVEQVVSLYTEGGLHITGPEAHQRGTVTFDGAEALTLMLRRRSERYEQIRYRIDTVTAREKTVSLFHHAQGPWDGDAIAVQFTLAQTDRETGVRYVYPGAAFFHLREGKIQVLRVYRADAERAEVEPRP